MPCTQPINAHTCYAVNGTQPQDWDAVLTLAQRHPDNVYPSVGLHPWHAQLWNTTVGEELQRLLQDHPNAGVGESGLDKPHTRRQPNPADSHRQQLDALRAHIHLAAQYQRPLSLHCVQSYGTLADVLTRTTNTNSMRNNSKTDSIPLYASPSPTPPAVVMHAYTGSPDTTTRLVHATPHSQHTRVFFSLSGRTLMRLPPDKMRVVVGAIPLDRVLLETDTDGRGEVMCLQETCALVAPLIAGGVKESVLQEASVRNAQRVFCL